MAAALGVRRHARAETLAVAATVAGARVGQAVRVEPGDIHLKFREKTMSGKRKRDFIMPVKVISERRSHVVLYPPEPAAVKT